MKDPVNIILVALVICLLGYTVYKNTGGASSEHTAVVEGPVDANGYTVIDIEGSDVKKLEKYNESNILIESGETLNGLKNGTWTTYHPEGRVKSISSYINGKLDGIQINISDRGHVELQAMYKDGLLNGNWTSYQSGSRKLEERYYVMGKMNGVNKHYNKTGKLQKEIGFKDDLQHGIFKYYDDEGNVTLEYEYKNGEKVSGGIVSQ